MKRDDPRRKIPTKDLPEIVKLLREGATTQDIGEMYDTDRKTVALTLRMAGYTTRRIKNEGMKARYIWCDPEGQYAFGPRGWGMQAVAKQEDTVTNDAPATPEVSTLDQEPPKPEPNLKTPEEELDALAQADQALQSMMRRYKEMQEQLAEAKQDRDLAISDMRQARTKQNEDHTVMMSELAIMRKERDDALASAQKAWKQAREDHQDALSWREYHRMENNRKAEMAKQGLLTRVSQALNMMGEKPHG